MTEWIKVSDKPPEDGQMIVYICNNNSMNAGVGVWSESDTYLHHMPSKPRWMGRITHWMPLPTLEKEEHV